MAKDANLGITGTRPITPTASLNISVPAVDQTAIDAAHGMHVQPNIPSAAALYPADMKLGDAAAALGNQVMADGTAEAPHYNQFGQKTA